MTGDSNAMKTPPLFFQRRFLPMWIALALGAFADNALRQALLIGVPYGAIDIPGFANDDDALPIIGVLLPAAILIFSPISGQLADKFETSFMFRRVKFAEIVLMAIAGLGFMTGNGILCVAMLFAMGAQSAFFSPVRIAAMPKYLSPDELVRGNGLCNAGLYVSILIGYAVGGVLIVKDGGGQAVAATLVAAAVLGWFAVRFALPAGANDPGHKISYNPLTQALAMFRHVLASPGVTPPLLGVGVFYFLSTAVTVLVPLYCRDALNADPFVATSFNGLFAVGAGLGAVAAASLPKKSTGLGASTLSILAAACVCLAIALITPAAAGTSADPLTLPALFERPASLFLTLLLVAAAALMGVYIAPLQAAIQRRAPAPVRARVMAAGVFANAAFAIPGSLSILIITRNGLDPTLAFFGVALAMAAIGAVMIHRRRTRPRGLYDDARAAQAPHAE